MNDYRLRFEAQMVFYLVPLVVYFFIFKEMVYSLVAGGIMFVYLTMITAFLNRYFRTFIHYMLCDIKKYGGRIKLKSWHPRSYPIKALEATESRKLEGLTILITFGLSFVAYLISQVLVPETYFNHMMLGHIIFTTMIFYKEYRYILLTYKYSNHIFDYNERTVKIYKV